MENLSFEELTELKLLAFNVHKLELAAKLLSIVKQIYPVEYLASKPKRKRGRPKKKALVFKDLAHSLIRSKPYGKPIDINFMKGLFGVSS